jgi:membrane protease YdiL (CAAX protease family)
MKEAKPLIKHGWMRAILFALTFLAIIIIFNMVTGRLTGQPSQVNQGNTDPDTVSGLYQVAGFLITLLIAAVTVYFFRIFVDKKDLSSLGLPLKNNLSHGATGFFLALLLLGIGTLILIANKNLQWTGINFNFPQLFIGVAGMAIVAFWEELVFRGYILNNLMESVNKYMALVYSALLFALVHYNNPGMNIISMVNILLAGLLLGINYIFTRNLWFGILFHFAWNFYQGAVLGYRVSGISLKSLFEQQINGSPLLTGGTFGFEGSLIAGILSLLSVLALAMVYRQRYIND